MYRLSSLWTRKRFIILNMKNPRILQSKPKNVEFDVERFTAQMVANVFGISVSAVYKRWVPAGCPVNKDGSYRIAEVIKWHTKREVEKKVISHNGLARDIKETKQAEKISLEIMKLKGEVIAIEDVQRIMHQQVLDLKEYFTQCFTINAFELMTKLGIASSKEKTFKKEYEKFIKGIVNNFVKTGKDNELHFSEE